MSRLWSALYRDILKHPFTSANDAVKAEYSRRDAEKREAVRLRKEKNSLAARKRGILDELDAAGREKAMLER